MIKAPQYKNPVSLIPGGCIQMLDFRLERDRFAKLRRYFREIQSENKSDQSRSNTQLYCLVQNEDGDFVDMISGAPSDFDYEIDARKSLALWFNSWLPVPILRTQGQKWPDGEERFAYGPSNWARCFLSVAEDDPNSLHIVIAFDMTVEHPPEEGEIQFALSPKDVSAHATFQLANNVRDNAWFLNSAWVDEWLFHHWTKWQKERNKRYESEFVLDYLASYLTLLDVIQMAMNGLTVQVINPERDRPVDVDLILDIGNSRTSGMLVETLPQKMTNLNDSYLLQLRDLDDPQKIYTEPFETRVEFAEAIFGNDALSRRSGRRTPAFSWPSFVRVGPEAVRLSTQAVCAEGATGMSSPKRYLWDERAWQQTWRYNTGGGPEPMVTRGLIARRINQEGTPLGCFDLPEFRRNPVLRQQSREVAFESLFTRSSLMMFMMVEVLLQALMTINSPAQRNRQELPNVPRRLRQIIFTVPPGMPVAEQRIYRRWVNWAVRLLWDALGWQDYYIESKDRRRTARSDFRMSPTVRCNWDEATCTQLVYLYNELNRKFQGDAYHLFNLAGKVRGQDTRPSLRVATLDIGGGTTDLSITTFFLDNEEGASARIRPRQEFRDGFTIAGDDILKDVINIHVLPAIAEAACGENSPQGRVLLGQLCGRELMDNSQEKRNRRAQFVRQLATPIALSLLSACEQTELLSGSGEWHCKIGDLFALPQDVEPEEAKKTQTEEAAEETTANGDELLLFGEAKRTPLPFAPVRHPYPGQAVLHYIKDVVRQVLSISDFEIMDVPLRIQPRQIDKTLSASLRDIIQDLCEVVQLYDCDILLLTGRPSRWNGVIANVFASLPVPPSCVMPMSRYRVGSWYPFSDTLGNITDPKTTVVVGAILCSLAEAHLEGFSFDTSRLIPHSSARFIGEMDIAGQLKSSAVWFNVDINSSKEQELTTTVMLSGPIAVGFRQLEAERWPTTRFYYIDFATEEARHKAVGRLPYKLELRFVVQEREDDPTRPEDETRDEGELFISGITDASDTAVNRNEIEIRLQTLPQDEGYWLDTGIVYRAV